MKNSLRTSKTGFVLGMALLCAAPVALRATTLADLAAGGSITVGDKVFYEFHNIVQTGDLSVALNDISVDPIIGGPGALETEEGIRFTSTLWTLVGPDLAYDLGFDFHVRQAAGLATITDNTLEITGNYMGDGQAQIAEGVLDHLSGATLANKYVFFDKNGAQLQDHQVYPGGPYVELEISKDFSMVTGSAADSRVFVSHFDQTFSQMSVPEGGPGVAGAATLCGFMVLASCTRSRKHA